MPPKGKKNNNKLAASPANVTGGEPSSSASPSTTLPQNSLVAPPLAPIFTSSSPKRGRSPFKRPRANTSDTPPPTNTMESLVSSVFSHIGIRNEQATTLRNFAKIIAEIHQFKAQCSWHIITLMNEMNAVQATIISLTACIAVLETATTTPSPQDTTTGPSNHTPPPPPPPPPPPSPSPSHFYAPIATKAPDPPAEPTKKNLEKLVNTETTKLQRQLVVTGGPTPPTTISNDPILASVNSVLKTADVQFILARPSLKGNLVLHTIPANTASEALAHTSARTTDLQALGCHPLSILANAI
ncbi:hypothetical protein Q9L58_004033 [Maublancomyces gigas]|uniref:Uncharacterized protein n=1 Tax=Discina gigas TaxID=1032678 RepID=A0ABR3GLY6_9PEZI